MAMNGHNGNGVQPDHMALVRALVRANADGEITYPLSDNLPKILDRFHLSDISYPLVEQFKAEVDQLVRQDTREAVAVAELANALASHSTDPHTQALGARTKGMALHLHARYDDAVASYETARKLYQLANEPVERARVERALVDALIYLGGYEKALNYADQARVTLIEFDEKRLLAQLESNVGNLFHRLDMNSEALESYTKAARYFEATADSSGLARTSFNRANVFCNLDDFRQAETLYEQAHELHIADNNRLGAVQARYSIGYLHFLRGNYHQAMRVLHETRTDFIELGEMRWAGLCLLDLAEIYLQLNVFHDAALLATQAQEIFDSLNIRYEAARSLTFLGLAQLRLRKIGAAEDAFQIARKEFEAEGNQVQLGLLNLHQGEAALLSHRPRYAAILAEEAEEIFLRHKLKTKTIAAQLLRARARLTYGFPMRDVCENALNDPASQSTPSLRMQAHELLGDSFFSIDEESAREHYSKAIALIEEMRAQIRVDEFRSAFFRDKLRVYEKLIRLCLKSKDAAAAFYYLESSKARTLVDALVNELEFAPAHRNDSELRTQWHQLREELHWHYSKLNQTETSENSRKLADVEQLRAEIARLEQSLVTCTRTLQATDPAFVWLKQSSGITVQSLRALLKLNETVVEYYFEGSSLKIFVIDCDGLHLVTSPIDLENIQIQVQYLRFQFGKFTYGPDYLAAHATQMLAATQICLHQLWKALIEPINDLLAGRKLVIIPFGLLHNVPFQALYDGSNYLLEDHEITQAPSAQLLQLSARQGAQRPSRSSNTPVVFGVADANAPQIMQEIEAIRALFPDAHYYTGAAATADAFTQAAPTGGILHIASHAVFRQDNPFFSAFKLADTWLNLYDITGLKLPASLVTLSGCSTGESRIYAGDELMGLAHGFLAAGAAELIVSLWPVNDPATAQLMTAFYQKFCDGAATPSALREAALAVKLQHPHPYYWSPFILLNHA